MQQDGASLLGLGSRASPICVFWGQGRANHSGFKGGDDVHSFVAACLGRGKRVSLATGLGWVAQSVVASGGGFLSELAL